MDALQLVSSIAQAKPEYSVTNQLRYALLLAVQNEKLSDLSDSGELTRQCDQVSMQLNATTDQHAAVSDELESLAATTPCEFTPDHVWSLVRAIKVQSQILNMYLG